MGEPENPPSPSSSSDDRRQWQRIFAALVEMVQSQQSQIEILADDRKFLEDYIRLQRSNWASRASLLKSHFSQMKKEEEMVRRVHAAKLNLMVSAKEREALLYKKQLELAESDLEDFRVCVETLGAEMLELKEKLKCSEADKGEVGVDDLKTVKGLEEKEQIADIEREMRKSKHEYKKLISKKDANIAALLAEKDFVWDQFKRMDNDYADLVKTKRMEDERANETIQMLHRSLEVLQSSADGKDETIANLETERARFELDVQRLTQEAERMDENIGKLQLDVEGLQSSADGKDETIANLETERARLESDVQRLTQEAERTNEKTGKLQLDVEGLQSLDKEKDETIARLRSEVAKFEMSFTRCTRGKSRFSKDLDPQCNSRNDLVTPRGSLLRKRSGKSSLQVAEGSASQKRRLVYEGSSGSRAAGTVIGLHRGMAVLQVKTSASPLETPRLFSSKLKVPKLKNLPPELA